MGSAIRVAPEAAALLADADARLETGAEGWRTLDPTASRASTLSEIASAVLEADADVAGAAAFADALVGVADAVHEAFPDNLLWDLDFVAASMWGQAGGDLAALADHAAAIVSVVRLFGRHTAIGFAYVHDFTYGFDWAKWVARDRAGRVGVHPFGRRFVAVMQARGDELLRVIDAGVDAKYPPIAGDRPRNPFGFSREPADELGLHRHLAAHGVLPVQTYRVDASVDPTPDYTALRIHAAVALGLDD